MRAVAPGRPVDVARLHRAAFQRPGQGSGAARIERTYCIGAQARIGRGVDQHVEPTAAGQAEIDIGRTRTVAQLFARNVAATKPPGIFGERSLQAPVRQIACETAIRADRQLCAGAPGKAAVDLRDGGQRRAGRRRCAQGGIVAPARRIGLVLVHDRQVGGPAHRFKREIG